MSKITGGCLCGAVRFESSAEPKIVVACHCSTCQKNTGSAFSMNVAMPEDRVTISGDSLKHTKNKTMPEACHFTDHSALTMARRFLGEALPIRGSFS
jgi:hypothetical protein